MAQDMTDLQLLHELEPVVETNINRHMSMRKDWNPHDYIPWSDGKNYYALGGQDWDPEQSKLSEVARVSMLQNLLTEDNLPSYHREIAMSFSMAGAWGQWANRWTAPSSPPGSILLNWSSCVSSRSRVGSAPARTSRAKCSQRACSTRSSMSHSRRWPPGCRP